MLKKILLNIIIIFSIISFGFSADINLPELSTVIDGSFVEIPADVIPDFNKIENPNLTHNQVPEIPQVVEEIEVPEVVPEPIIQVVETEKNNLNCELQFLVSGAFPGVLGTNLSFLHNNNVLPFEISFKQETLFHGNKHTRLSPSVKMHFNPTEKIGLNFSAYYLAQCADYAAETSHVGRVDFGLDFCQNNFSVLGNVAVAFGKNIFVVPFDLAFHYEKPFGIFKLNGGLKSTESNLITFAKNNPKNIFSNYNDVMKNINMESFWYGGFGYAKDFAKYFNVDFGIELLYTALENYYLISNFQENTIDLKKGLKLNTALDLSFEYKIFDFDLQLKSFWLDNKYMLINQELNLFMGCDVTEKLTVCLNIIHAIQMFMGKGGEFALGAKLLF